MVVFPVGLDATTVTVLVLVAAQPDTARAAEQHVADASECQQRCACRDVKRTPQS
jgi:hypothetical protein